MKPQVPDDCRRVLERVGTALIVLGCVDIAMMVYCGSQGVSYSSSFNIFAVLAGIYVKKGHPWWVKWVTRAAAFYAGAFCAMPVVFPLIFPLDLVPIELRLHPLLILGGTAVSVAVTALLIWVYRQLRTPPVLNAFSRPGRAPDRAWLGSALGVALAVGMGITFVGLAHSDSNRKAIELAAAKTGGGYRYVVSRLSWSGGHGRARVVAYRSDAIKSVDVEW